MNQRMNWVAAIVGSSLIAAACGSKQDDARPEVRPVRMAIVGESVGSVGASYSGEIRARFESRVGFQTSGRVAARLVEVGSRVRRGQMLMRLDPAQESLHVVAAVADVEAAKSRVAQDRVDLERTRQLLGRQFASQAELDQQQLALAQSESQLKAALAQQAIKVNQRGYTELLADRDGVVSAIGAEVGQVVSPGQAVVTIAADGEREVVISIPESRVDELRQATTLQVSAWARRGRFYGGSLRELAPDTDSVTRTYSARIAIKDPDAGLMLGMTATVFAPDVDGQRAVRLPLTAIYDRSGQPMVWVIDPATSKASTRAVTLGSAHDDSVLIAGGLRGGEAVVTAGVHLLHEGQKVKPLADAASARRLAKAE